MGKKERKKCSNEMRSKNAFLLILTWFENRSRSRSKNARCIEEWKIERKKEEMKRSLPNSVS